MDSQAKTLIAFFAGALIAALTFYLYSGGFESCAKNEYPTEMAREYLCSVKPIERDTGN